MRIRDNINTLSKFSELRQEGRSRDEYLTLLKKDLAFVYVQMHMLVHLPGLPGRARGSSLLLLKQPVLPVFPACLMRTM